MKRTIFFTRYLWLLGENFNSIVDSNPRPCPWNKSLVIKSMIQLNRSEPMDSYSLSNVIRCKPEPELGICVCRWDNNFISKKKKWSSREYKNGKIFSRIPSNFTEKKIAVMKLRVGDNNNIFFSTEKSHAVCIFPFFLFATISSTLIIKISSPHHNSLSYNFCQAVASPGMGIKEADWTVKDIIYKI